MCAYICMCKECICKECMCVRIMYVWGTNVWCVWEKLMYLIGGVRNVCMCVRWCEEWYMCEDRIYVWKFEICLIEDHRSRCCKRANICKAQLSSILRYDAVFFVCVERLEKRKKKRTNRRLCWCAMVLSSKFVSISTPKTDFLSCVCL